MLKTYTFMLAATLVGCSFSDAGLQGGSGLTDDLGQLEDLSLADLSLPDLGLPDLGQPEDLGQPDLNVPDLGPDGASLRIGQISLTRCLRDQAALRPATT